jgi:glycosyltransferase involved in cell wall biosynthesis
MRVSVLLCAHDPNPDRLCATLDLLRAQSLPTADWELILIDNASSPPLVSTLLAWHPHGRVVREGRLGLTRARARGIAEAESELLVFCDDDNLLARDYLQRALDLFASRPTLGAAGGKSLHHYASPLPKWFEPFADLLALRYFGEEEQVASWLNLDESDRAYPAFAPIGAGMVLRREIALEYARKLEESPAIPDRVGRGLSSGGDNAMVLAALRAGWQVGYFPGLRLTHLIPAERLRLRYLARLNRASSESWVRVLAHHELFPWRPISRWTVGLRQLRAFFVQQAWRGPARYFQWAGACGLFEGRARIAKLFLAHFSK